MDNWIYGTGVGRRNGAGRSSRSPLRCQSAHPALACRRGGRVVYCGGLENRFGLTADGGSNPSLSARRIVKRLMIWAVVVGVAFAILWWKGYLLRLSTYIQQTREELRKCTWPTWDELKGSTVLIGVSIMLLGAFIVVADVIFVYVNNWILKL